MERKRRKDSFFGLHFDFHANPDTLTGPVGGRLTADMIREICETIRPDFLQIDCKGHPGWASYPSKMGNGVEPQAMDTLKLWRSITAEYGVALYMHYSGVIDGRYAAAHPEEARYNADGKPDEKDTSVFGRYVDDLLIPQMKELAGDYGVDGIWIDGECWGTDLDYSPKALEVFFRETGKDLREDPPVTEDHPDYREYQEFCREGFRRYLRHYVDTMHAIYPDFQIASNWAFTGHMPEPVSVDVDFLSGDYSPQDSFNTARYDGRIIEAQGMPWDLMAWNFRHDFETGHSCPKHPEQIKQEAAAVMSLGGGFQNYITQQRDGTPRMEQIRRMKEVAEFCRARQPWCHKGRLVPQTVLFNSRWDQYHTKDRLFINQNYEAIRGWTQLLCEDQQSVDIRSEHNFLEDHAERFPMAVVADLRTGIPEETAKALLTYAEQGGGLVLSGRKAIEALAAAGAPISVEDPGVGGEPFYSVDGGPWASCFGSACRIAAPCGEVLATACSNQSGEPEEQFDTAIIFRYGRGQIAAIGFDMGLQYYKGMSAEARRLIHMIRERIYLPEVLVTGSRFCDVTVLEKDGKRYIQLVNTCGGHGDPREMTIDEIPPIGPLKISIKVPDEKTKVILRPEGLEMPGEYRNGRFETILDRLEIHEILEIE